jgi:hypothetical protein
VGNETQFSSSHERFGLDALAVDLLLRLSLTTSTAFLFKTYFYGPMSKHLFLIVLPLIIE